MLTNLKSRAKGSFVFFAPEGDAYTLPGPGGAVSEDLPPATNDPVFRALTDCQSFEPSIVDENAVSLYGPTPSKLSRTGRIVTKDALDLKFTTNKFSNLEMGIIYRHAVVLDNLSTFINPMTGQPPNGWLLFQEYVTGNTNLDAPNIIGLCWGQLDIEGGRKSGDGSIIMPEFNFHVFYNYYNILS